MSKPKLEEQYIPELQLVPVTEEKTNHQKIMELLEKINITLDKIKKK